MARNIYPLFERNRLMRKEFLWALRDYSYGFMQLEYEKYADGILEGLDIHVTKDEIKIGTGIVKYRGSIIIFEKEEMLHYEPTEQFRSLKLKMKQEKSSEDYILNSGEPFLDADLECKEDEFEICRFKLKAGARLRNNYIGFYDIETEFDTVNLVNATWAAIEKPGLSPVITRYFAKEAIKCKLSSRDSSFIALCLNTTKSIAPEVVAEYIRAKLEIENMEFTNQQTFEHLEMILRNIQDGTELRPARKYKKKREIIVD